VSFCIEGRVHYEVRLVSCFAPQTPVSEVLQLPDGVMSLLVQPFHIFGDAFGDTPELDVTTGGAQFG